MLLRNSISLAFVVVLSLLKSGVALRFTTSYNYKNAICSKSVIQMASSAELGSERDYKSEILKTLSLIRDNVLLDSSKSNIESLCDKLDDKSLSSVDRFIYQTSQQRLLTNVLKRNRLEYMEVVKSLGNRISRNILPNLQEIPPPQVISSSSSSSVLTPTSASSTSPSIELIMNDCNLPNITFTESILDKFLLSLFRKFVQEEIKFTSPKDGILGLLEEGRYYYLSDSGTPENQHKFVRTILGRLLTPFLPPFYRIFMAGIIPTIQNNDPIWLVNSTNYILSQLPTSLQKELTPGRQFGPWFYAPFLTSFVTPPFLSFLVGPSRLSRRKDGELGGMVIEKCKFLQESGCKGLCLHQCKLPAQQFFADTLGLPLTVSPNFETQECQWSWGETPVDPALDPTFPRGCLANCPSRGIMKQQQQEGGGGGESSTTKSSSSLELIPGSESDDKRTNSRDRSNLCNA